MMRKDIKGVSGNKTRKRTPNHLCRQHFIGFGGGVWSGRCQKCMNGWSCRGTRMKCTLIRLTRAQYVAFP